MICLELVDDFRECRVGAADCREYVDILTRMMQMNEAAVVEAVGFELPEWAKSLQAIDLLLNAFCALPVSSVVREPAANLQVVPKNVVYPLELTNEMISRMACALVRLGIW